MDYLEEKAAQKSLVEKYVLDFSKSPLSPLGIIKK
jgi:hypothetical protein